MRGELCPRARQQGCVPPETQLCASDSLQLPQARWGASHMEVQGFRRSYAHRPSFHLHATARYQSAFATEAHSAGRFSIAPNSTACDLQPKFLVAWQTSRTPDLSNKHSRLSAVGKAAWESHRHVADGSCLSVGLVAHCLVENDQTCRLFAVLVFPHNLQSQRQTCTDRICTECCSSRHDISGYQSNQRRGDCHRKEVEISTSR